MPFATQSLDCEATDGVLRDCFNKVEYCWMQHSNEWMNVYWSRHILVNTNILGSHYLIHTNTLLPMSFSWHGKHMVVMLSVNCSGHDMQHLRSGTASRSHIQHECLNAFNLSTWSDIPSSMCPLTRSILLSSHLKQSPQGGRYFGARKWDRQHIVSACLLVLHWLVSTVLTTSIQCTGSLWCFCHCYVWIHHCSVFTMHENIFIKMDTTQILSSTCITYRLLTNMSYAYHGLESTHDCRLQQTNNGMVSLWNWLMHNIICHLLHNHWIVRPLMEYWETALIKLNIAECSIRMNEWMCIEVVIF